VHAATHACHRADCTPCARRARVLQMLRVAVRIAVAAEKPAGRVQATHARGDPDLAKLGIARRALDSCLGTPSGVRPVRSRAQWVAVRLALLCGARPDRDPPPATRPALTPRSHLGPDVRLGTLGVLHLINRGVMRSRVPLRSPVRLASSAGPIGSRFPLGAVEVARRRRLKLHTGSMRVTHGVRQFDITSSISRNGVLRTLVLRYSPSSARNFSR
jgi:hypothetical protein